MKSKEEIEEVARILIDSVVQVHRALGPGLLESADQACLAHELSKRGQAVRCEVPQLVEYDGLYIDAGYRIDMLIADVVIVENKSLNTLLPVHEAQLLTYLKLSGKRLGFLINWNVRLIKDGIQRLVNNL